MAAKLRWSGREIIRNIEGMEPVKHKWPIKSYVEIHYERACIICGCLKTIANTNGVCIIGTRLNHYMVKNGK